MGQLHLPTQSCCPHREKEHLLCCITLLNMLLPKLKSS
uniref:Uncharacterized protein n=1 Tax=Arundo donax TaxID=35708 RepID=A0A0A8YX84_ARUDO